MSELKEIPKHWEIKKLGEVCDKISLNGIKIKQKDYLAVGKFPVINQGQEIIGGYFNDEKLVVPTEPPYIIFGDHTKVKKFINFKFIAGADGVKVLKPHTIYDPKFFFFLISTVNIPDKGYARHFQFLEKEEIPLPPLHEQLTIVSKIEELLSDLENGKQQLQTAQQQLKVYRQSLLKAAFEGKLTHLNHDSSDLHDEHDLNIAAESQIEYIKNQGSDNLPKGWKWVKIIDIVENNKHSLKAGPFGSSLKKEFYVANGYKIYGQEQVINDDPFYGDYYINDEKYQELKSCKIKPSNVLISLVGTVGKVLILPENCKEVIINPRFIKVSLNKEIYLAKFFKYYFEGSFVKNFYVSKAKGTTMKVLNLGIIKSIPFPLPPAEEQQRIVNELESKLTVCDKIEETISHSLQQAETLWQSILKKAFEGRLV